MKKKKKKRIRKKKEDVMESEWQMVKKKAGGNSFNCFCGLNALFFFFLVPIPTKCLYWWLIEI